MVHYFFSYLMENKLPTKERNELDDSEFGVVYGGKRRFPLHDRAHVLAAIRMFHHCPPEHRAELAKNIKRKMKEYDIPESTIGPDNELRKYL